MKYRKDVRQVTALVRAVESLERWKKLLKQSPEQILEHPDVKITGINTKAEAFVQDKINKAEKCIANLEAKGVTLTPSEE